MSDSSIRKVQGRLNKLSLYVLGLWIGNCDDSPAGRLVRQQALLAMSPELDDLRLSDADSFAECVKI